jgi:hypothetical protein
VEESFFRSNWTIGSGTESAIRSKYYIVPCGTNSC